LQQTLANPQPQVAAATQRYEADYTINAVTQKYISVYQNLKK